MLSKRRPTFVSVAKNTVYFSLVDLTLGVSLETLHLLGIDLINESAFSDADHFSPISPHVRAVPEQEQR